MTGRPPDPNTSRLALAVMAATVLTFGVIVFLIADVSRLHMLRWAAAVIVAIAIGIVVHVRATGAWSPMIARNASRKGASG
jgi:hypothetical protein